MAKKKREEAHGGHGWFVTFADLMALLVAFFVMLVAFSTQDCAKLQIVAGSMRDAFGVQQNVRYSGIIEVDGLPTRPQVKNVAKVSPNDASATPGPDDKDHAKSFGARLKKDSGFALASASLRQALQDMPEITDISKNIMMEETEEGLNIEIVDQDGRSMFPDGSKTPYERTRKIIEKSGPSSRRCRTGCRFPATPRPRASPPGRAMAPGTCPPTAPMRSARFCRNPAYRPRISTWWPAVPTPSRYFRTIPILPRTGA